MTTAREATRAESTEKLLQPETPAMTKPPSTVVTGTTTTSSNSGYFTDPEGGGGDNSTSSNDGGAIGGGGGGSSSGGGPYSSPIGGGGLLVSTAQSRNRVPLGLCVQQTAISTPSASISVEEPPIMISTDDDPDNVQLLLGRRSSYERSGNSIDSSSHTVHDAELTLGTGSISHSLHSSSAMVGGGSSSAYGGSTGGGIVHYERGGSFPGNPHLHDPSCKHR